IDFGKAIFSEKEVTIIISGWIGEVDIVLPPDLPVSINASIRIGSMKILGHGLDGVKREFINVTEGYESATKRLNLIIRFGIGEVNVTRHV
ncbi:MAG: cell wall-active antibiotics response protein LiaF, partial [Bacilli bacterium]